MPPKRSKSGGNSAAGQRWEQGLLSAPFIEEVSEKYCGKSGSNFKLDELDIDLDVV